MRISICTMVLAALFLTACGKEKKPIVKPVEISFTKEGTIQIFKPNDSLAVQLEIEIAEDEYERETGLMHRKNMRNDRGMLFIFPEEQQRSFYMKNTEFALDIIFIGADLRIKSFAENAQPMDESSLYSQVPAKYVLEVNAGLAEKWLLDVGDRIEFRRD